MFYGHGLKICMWLGYNLWNFFVIFSQFELSHIFGQFSEWIEGSSHIFGQFSEWIEGSLCAQLLLQFNTDTFETLQTL